MSRERLSVLIKKYMPALAVNPQVAKDLECLHPGKEKDSLLGNFYSAKAKKALCIAAGGIVIAVFLGFRSGMERRLDLENTVERDDFAGAVQRLNLEAVIGKEREQFQVQVYPRQLDDREAQELFNTFRDELPALIAGENPFLGEVRSNLLLEERFEGYPFSVEWRSDNVDVVSSAGNVKAADEDCEVLLVADVTYGELSWQEELSVTVPARELTREERRHWELEEVLLEGEEAGRGESRWELPGEWQGESITWSLSADDYSLPLAAGALVAAVLVYFVADRDLHEKAEKRKRRMKLEYPDIVHKLVLYLGAGLALRGAFQKIASEYELERENGKAEGPAYEEMCYTCRELKSGVSETEAYAHFGKRTGLQEYIRLTALLAQNLKKGSGTLLQRLGEEADRASLERIQNSRRLGEEASTKLLVPMVMMLAVVMVMVMLPALTSMGA